MKSLITIIVLMSSFASFAQTFYDTQFYQSTQPGHKNYVAPKKKASCYLGGRYTLQTLANEIGDEVEAYIEDEQPEIKYRTLTAWNPVKLLKSYNPSNWFVNSDTYFRLITLDVKIYNENGQKETVQLKDCDARYTTYDHVFTIEECLIKTKGSKSFYKDPEMVFYVDLSDAKRC